MEEAKQILWYLKKFPMLSALSAEAFARLAGQVELRSAKRRSVVYLPGDPGPSIFLVHGGRVKVSKVTRDGKALTLCYCGPADLFGEHALVEGAPRQEMAEAVENSVMTEINYKVFHQLLLEQGMVGLKMAQHLAQRRHTLENKLEMLVFRDVTSKLAQLLIQLSEEYGIEEARGTMIALKITHQELANLIGSTRETVSLTLSQFKKEGVVCTDGRKLIVCDHSAMLALT